MQNAYNGGEWVSVEDYMAFNPKTDGDIVEVKILYRDGHAEVHDGECVDCGILIPTAGNSFRNKYVITHVRKKALDFEKAVENGVSKLKI